MCQTVAAAIFLHQQEVFFWLLAFNLSGCYAAAPPFARLGVTHRVLQIRRRAGLSLYKNTEFPADGRKIVFAHTQKTKPWKYFLLLIMSDNTHDVVLHTDHQNTFSSDHNEMVMDYGVD